MEYFKNERQIYFAKMSEKAIIPSKKDEDAGYDIYACFEEDFIKLKPHQTVLIPTQLAWACHPDFYMQIEERSSTGSKGIKRSAGIIDSGYRGEIKIAITNSNDRELYFSNLKEDKLKQKYEIEENSIIYPTTKAIAQGVIHRVEKMKVNEINIESLLKIPSERGEFGFGSTNK